MARNRKYQSAAIRFGPALKALLLCLLIGRAGVGYVWQKSQIYELGRQIESGRSGWHNCATQNEKLSDQLAMLNLASNAGPARARIESGPGAGPADAGLAAGRAGSPSE